MSLRIVIPARLESSRLARKLLLDETGHPLIWHTVKAVCDAFPEKDIYDITVCSDSEEILNRISGPPGISIASIDGVFCSTVFDSETSFRNGTERIAGFMRDWEPEEDPSTIILHVQADEPEVPPEALRACVELLNQCPTCDLATICTDLDPPDLDNPNVVKVHAEPSADSRKVHWFSRLPQNHLLKLTRHVGVYAYRVSYLRAYMDMPPTESERAKNLEQCRLSSLIAVRAHYHPSIPPGINTRADYDQFVQRWKERQG